MAVLHKNSFPLQPQIIIFNISLVSLNLTKRLQLITFITYGTVITMHFAEVNSKS